MALTVENIVNLALDAIGYGKHIADIYEGSPPARVALELYGQTRDEVLQSGEWPFARREATLSANGQTPLSPWANEYTYPADCLKVLNVRPSPLTGGARSTDPQPVLWEVVNDARPPTPIRAILCDLTLPTLVYVGRVTDPATWEPGFVKAFVGSLAEKFSLSPLMAASAELVKVRVGLGQRDMAEGMAASDGSFAQSQPQATGRQ